MLRAAIVGWLLVACGPRVEPALPPRVETRGDVTWHSDASTVVVTVRRAFGGRAATGDATLLATTWDAALASPHQRLAAARAWLAVGVALDAPNGYAALRRGLDELGDAYDEHRGFDDTSTLIRMAADEQDPARARATLQKALESRIARYVHRYRDAVR